MSLKQPLRWMASAWAICGGRGSNGQPGERWSTLASRVVRISVWLLACGLLVQQMTEGVHDPYRCEALVHRGSWPAHVYKRRTVDVAVDYESLAQLKLQGQEPVLPLPPFDKWEPAGCRMHEYSRDDIRGCLGGQRLLFVGDAAMRQVFFAALTRVDHEVASWLLRSIFVEQNPRHNLAIEVESIQFDFIWDPWLNSSAVLAELERASSSSPPPPKDDDVSQPATLILLGAPGLWAARSGGDEYLSIFQSAVDAVEPYLQSWVRPASAAAPSSANSYVFLSPVPVPRFSLLSPSRSAALSPDRIRRLNDYLDRQLSPAAQSHVLNAYNAMTHDVPEAYEDTGLHVTGPVAERMIDVPLNARCNAWLTSPTRDPPAPPPGWAAQRTCCVAYPAPVRGQLLTGLVLAVFVLVPAAVSIAKALGSGRGRGSGSVSGSGSAGRWPWSWPPVAGYSMIGIAVFYCYMADGSQLFAKAEKHPDLRRLKQLLFLTATAFMASWTRYAEPPVTGERLRGDSVSASNGSLASKRQSRMTAAAAASALDPIASSPEFDILPRQVSDEWKGLMQTALLLIAYLGTPESLVIYKWTRFCAGAYLFLSAYGHTSYFLRTNDFSLGSVAAVLFRINALPCLVDLMMNLPPQSEYHYFPRVVSFWFLVVYVTVWSRRGHHGDAASERNVGLLLARIAAAAVVVGYVLLWPHPVYGVFEWVVHVAKVVCCSNSGARANKIANWNPDEMRRLIALDRFSPVLGMLVAVLAWRVTLVHRHMHRLQGSLVTAGQTARPGAADGSSAFDGTGKIAAAKRRRLLAHQLQTEYVAGARTNARVDGFLANVLYPADFTAPAQPMLVSFGVVLCFLFIYETGLSFTSNDRAFYDALHPYLSATVVLAAVVLRNVDVRLRRVYLASPAVLGRCALELSVLHRHVLLSGNGAALLRIGTFGHCASSSGCGVVAAAGQALERAVLATVLVWMAVRTHEATKALSGSLFGRRLGTTVAGSRSSAESHEAGRFNMINGQPLEASNNENNGLLDGPGIQDAVAYELPPVNGGHATAVAPTTRAGWKWRLFANVWLRAAGVLFVYWAVNVVYYK